jgi:dTMP kinase
MTHFIVFEGIDGSGKTTLVNNIAVNLRKNFKVKTAFEADGLFTEDLICGKYVEHNVDVFLFWARRFQQQKELLKEIDNYDVVLQDRYYDSTYVYQKTLKTDKPLRKFNYNPDLFGEPDITFILDVKPEIALERIKDENKDFFEKCDILEMVNRRNQYLNLPIKFNDRHFIILNTEYLDEEDLCTVTYKIILEELKNIQPKHFNLLRKSLQEKL